MNSELLLNEAGRIIGRDLKPGEAKRLGRLLAEFASGPQYPFPIHLENPESRLLLEVARLVNDRQAQTLLDIAIRLQDDWLDSR